MALNFHAFGIIQRSPADAEVPHLVAGQVG